MIEPMAQAPEPGPARLDRKMPNHQTSLIWVISGLVVLTLLATAAVLYLFDPRFYSFYPTCLFHRTTGLLCPGCGSLRAVHELLHGHLRAAFHYNPLLVAGLPFLAVYGAVMLS